MGGKDRTRGYPIQHYQTSCQEVSLFDRCDAANDHEKSVYAASAESTESASG